MTAGTVLIGAGRSLVFHSVVINDAAIPIFPDILWHSYNRAWVLYAKIIYHISRFCGAFKWLVIIVTDANLPSNIPNPDPSVVSNERMEEAKVELRREMVSRHTESRGWVDSLQVLLEREIARVSAFVIEKIEGGLRNIGTRLDGNDTALVAALKAQKEEAAKQTENFKEVLGESKKGTEKQFDSLNEKIDDVKDRLNRVEATNVGASYNRSDSHQEAALRQHGVQNTISTIAAIASVLAVLISLGVAIYTVTRQVPEVHVTGSVGQPQRSGI
jgi:hypothetical protein